MSSFLLRFSSSAIVQLGLPYAASHPHTSVIQQHQSINPTGPNSISNQAIRPIGK